MRSPRRARSETDLVIVTGVSGSGKGTVLKSLEDLGYYSVDNLPTLLIPKFAELAKSSPEIRSAALGVDVREGSKLRQFPEIYEKLKRQFRTTLVFLEAGDAAILRRFSETRRPHPLGKEESVTESLAKERKLLLPVRRLADHIIDTSDYTVTRLRQSIAEKFRSPKEDAGLTISVTSFGFRHGIPTDSDLVFDVRFLPNPNYIPRMKKLTGSDPKVAAFVRSHQQTIEFLDRVTDLLIFLLPHYINEGKSYLTVSFGCTGGRHRSVMIAEEIRGRIAKVGYDVKLVHRDSSEQY
ncbi:MAG: RNase adapter RapZ [Candidatus Solibacter usitatus]|nr:RNase adapter RapZ [Candidatus Solibacter usitatus]